MRAARPSTVVTTNTRANRVARRARFVAALALGACTRAHGVVDDARVQGAAGRELFVVREHARLLVVWHDVTERGPTFDLLGRDDAALDSAALATTVTIPVIRVRSADLVRVFRMHPDGWAAFYAAYPGTPGLVEFTRPVWAGDTATVIVGRACGEHCFFAWRVTVRDGRVLATAPLHLPRS